jgi:hypothetical protein
MKSGIESYEAEIAAARAAFNVRISRIDSQFSRARCAIFLMNYCAQGVGMTRDVPNWIRGAGDATFAKGFAALGNALIAHAAHEQGHHEMMERDVDSLVQWWNERHELKMDARTIRHQGELAAVARYRDLHLDVIASNTPYTQIAVEFEIEQLSVEEGPKFFRRVIGHLDLQVVRCMSFLTEHVALDAGHTRYNRRALGRFLDEHPEALAPLIAAGTAALDAYAAFLEECFALSVNLVESLGLARARRCRRSVSTVIAEKFAAIAFLVRAFVQGRILTDH